MTIDQVETENWRARLVNEEKEMSDKLNKLGEFIHSRAFRDVMPAEQALLQEQDDAMRSYVHILRKRINGFS